MGARVEQQVRKAAARRPAESRPRVPPRRALNARWLGTLEYGLDLDRNWEPVLFVDGGKAWNESNHRTGGVGGSGPLALDGGLGLLLGSDAIRIDVARDLRAEHAPARVSFRLSHTF